MRIKIVRVNGWLIEPDKQDKGKYVGDDGKEGYYVVTGRWETKISTGTTIACLVQIIGGDTLIGRASLNSDGKWRFGGHKTRWGGRSYANQKRQEMKNV